jgi:hypothetical protein
MSGLPYEQAKCLNSYIIPIIRPEFTQFFRF